MSENKVCLWCNREIETDELLDCGNEAVGSLPYHEDCYYEVRDKLGQ